MGTEICPLYMSFHSTDRLAGRRVLSPNSCARLLHLSRTGQRQQVASAADDVVVTSWCCPLCCPSPAVRRPVVRITPGSRTRKAGDPGCSGHALCSPLWRLHGVASQSARCTPVLAGAAAIATSCLRNCSGLARTTSCLPSRSAGGKEHNDSKKARTCCCLWCLAA